MNSNRRFVVAGLACVVLWPAGLHAQSPQTQRRIACLFSGSPESHGTRLAAFKAGLADLGWKEGVNLHIDIASALNDPARFQALAAEIAGRIPALVVVARDSDAKAALPFTGAIPVLFANAFDPVGIGVVKSLANPGGTVTGISIQNWELSPKRMESPFRRLYRTRQ